MRKPGSGRPRVEGDREAEILDATLALLMEVGYDRLTLDGVSRRARVSKATLYRRWEGKPDLVVDAMVRAKQAPRVEAVDTGSLRGDLLATFCGPRGPGNAAATSMLGSVITALSSDPEFAERFRAAFIAPKIAASTAIYERAVRRGEIRDDLDVEIVAPALPGILLHRTFVLGQPADDALVERVVDHVILPAVGIAAPTATPTPSQHERQEARTS